MVAAAVNPWEWHPHPDVWVLIGVLVLGYYWALTRLGPAAVRPGEAVVTSRQRNSFVAGIVVLWIGADWPVHDISEKYLLSVHMVQHLLFTLIAPGLLMVGLPPWLWRRLLAVRSLGAVARTVARPLPAALIFNVVAVASHWPLVVDAALRSEPVHFAVHAVLVGSAVLMWFPVLNRQAGFPSMTYPGRMVYLFLQSIVPTVPASFLTFADGAIYRFYAEAPRAFDVTAVADQQMAGGLMKVAGGLVLWAVIVTMFFRWYNLSQGQPGETLTWDDVQREFDRTGPVA